MMDKNSVTPEGFDLEDIGIELRRLSNRLDAALGEGDNSVSVKCSLVLDEIPKCYDFSETRRFAACEAWRLMEKEKINWKEAMDLAWDKIKTNCTWN